MSQVFAVLHTDPALVQPLLEKLDKAVELAPATDKVVGCGYYDGARVLLRKRPVGSSGASLPLLAQGVKSGVFFAAVHRIASGAFREEDTAPYRFRNWLFAGTGKIVPLGERDRVVAALPEQLQRGLVGPSDSELAFLTTLAHIQANTRNIEHPDVSPTLAGEALVATLAKLDARADAAATARSETAAVISNGRFLAAVRRGRPLHYALIEGLPFPPDAATGKAAENDPKLRALRTIRGVAIASRPRASGLAWVEVPERSLLTVGRGLEIKVTPIA